MGMAKQNQRGFTHVLCSKLHRQYQHVCARRAELTAPELETDGQENTTEDF